MNKVIEALIHLIFVVLLFLAFSWCISLEKNLKIVQEQLYQYQSLNYDTDARQDKEIRLIKQDIKLIEKGDFYD